MKVTNEGLANDLRNKEDRISKVLTNAQQSEARRELAYEELKVSLVSEYSEFSSFFMLVFVNNSSPATIYSRTSIRFSLNQFSFIK